MLAEIVFAAGCFWGVEKHFESIDGVADVKSGYTGGNFNNPRYGQILNYRYTQPESGVVNHTEAVQVFYDPSKVSGEKLIKSFWEIHDPTQHNRQGNDLGNNYRSAIFYTTEKQLQTINKTKATYQTLLKEQGYGDIVTQIRPLTKFWPAEEYHQDYLQKNPNGYCPTHATGVKFEKEKKKIEQLTPLGDKEIVVIEADGFCPYCDKFDADVINRYKGTIPIRKALASEVKKYTIKTKLDATPTILFIENAKEVFSNIGYLNEKEFYERLGAFKLGKSSESYEVAFNKGTDSRFCKQYDLFKNTPDGVFIDKLSGEPLFDTKDRFNSGTGWLSFYKAVEGSVVEKPDYSYGMNRIEVLAKKSGIHLGHVFERVDGTRRFCINATVLEFKPRKQ